MKKILIPYVQDALKGTPQPHYLVGKAEISLLGENEIEFTGMALFPLYDVSIADRRDYVNVIAIFFALWNAAHLMAREIKRRNFRITKISGNYFKTFLPEEIIDLIVSASFKNVSNSQREKFNLKIVPSEQVEKKAGSLVHGKLRATFNLKEEKVAEVECKFVGWN